MDKPLAAIIDAVFSSILFGVGWVVNICLVGKMGYSIGKRITGLVVVKEDGRYPIGIVDALIRKGAVGKFARAIILGMGFLMIAFDPKKQGLHDRIAGTCVVHKKVGAAIQALDATILSMVLPSTGMS